MKKILVVDDSIVNLKMAEKVLHNQEDYKAILIPSGERALKFLSANVPDLILLDIMMPEMDGFEVLAQIKQNQALAQVPVAFLTADDTEETLAKAHSVGIDQLIHKPFDQQQLLTLVKKLLVGEES